MEPILTISIPTYNRAAELRRTVDRLVPQLTDGVQLHIYDNYSDTPAATTLQDYLHLPNVKVFRNATNIGGDANILQCYAQCITTWGWVLGDDDLPNEDAIRTILDTIAAHPHTVFINFSSNLCAPDERQTENTIARGQSDFIRKLKSFPNLLFISTNIYKMAEIKASLRNAYRFISSFGSQVSLVLDYLYENDAAVLFSTREVVHWNELEGTDARPDSVINKSLPDLLSLVKEDADRALLYQKLSVFHPFPQLSFKRLLHKQVFEPKHSRNASVASYVSDGLFINWIKGNLTSGTLLKTSALMVVIALVNAPIISAVIKPLMRRILSNGEQRKRFREVRKFDIYRHLKEDARL